MEQWFPGAGGGGGEQVTSKGCRVSVWEYEKFLEMNSGDGE